MGVSVRPIFGVGIEFGGKGEVEDFLNENGYTSTEDDEEHYGFEESFRELPEEFSIQCLNLYSGYGYVVYIPISLLKLEEVAGKVSQTIDVWNAFMKQKPQVVHSVVMS